MEIFLTILSIAFAIVIIILTAKIRIMKKTAREISEQFSKLIEGDTNALINVSSADKDMSNLATVLNTKLKDLREKELVYTNGDKELKSAITNVAHDIRTPLTAICGYVDMMKEDCDPAKLDRYLAIISERANALKVLSEELFKYSVSTNSEKFQEVEKVDVNLHLQETLFSFYTKFLAFARDFVFFLHQVLRKRYYPSYHSLRKLYNTHNQQKLFDENFFQYY